MWRRLGAGEGDSEYSFAILDYRFQVSWVCHNDTVLHNDTSELGTRIPSKPDVGSPTTRKKKDAGSPATRKKKDVGSPTTRKKKEKKEKECSSRRSSF